MFRELWSCQTPIFNLLIALDVLLNEASVAGAARRLNLSTSAMSRTLSRLRDVTGDQILVRAGRNMVLTPWAEATRDRARRAVFEAKAVLQPAAEALNVQKSGASFSPSGQTMVLWWRLTVILSLVS